MARVIRAGDVYDQLLRGGFDPSEWFGDDWHPGYRVAQHGRRQVNVFHDGPGEIAGLDQYQAELQACGYAVVPDQMPGGHRRRLHITKP
ncbi:hypothetical protein ABZ916_39345 [Streptomyces sp. NPDC046853]|uniref:hypothetical protein n=1 Tax=Streptomyces sp. NPDC046853 TaxID=3154920 RepID=UPI0033FE4A07